MCVSAVVSKEPGDGHLPGDPCGLRCHSPQLTRCWSHASDPASSRSTAVCLCACPRNAFWHYPVILLAFISKGAFDDCFLEPIVICVHLQPAAVPIYCVEYIVITVVTVTASVYSCQCYMCVCAQVTLLQYRLRL